MEGCGIRGTESQKYEVKNQHHKKEPTRIGGIYSTALTGCAICTTVPLATCGASRIAGIGALGGTIPPIYIVHLLHTNLTIRYVISVTTLYYCTVYSF